MKKLILLLVLCSFAGAKETVYLGGAVTDSNNWSMGYPEANDAVILDMNDLTIPASLLMDVDSVYVFNERTLAVEGFLRTSSPIYLMVSDPNLADPRIVLLGRIETPKITGKGFLDAVKGVLISQNPADNRTYIQNQSALIAGYQWLEGDLNGDMTVDFYDMAVLADNWLVR